MGALLDGIPESIVIVLSLLQVVGLRLVAVIATFLSNVLERLSSAAGMRQAGRSATCMFGLWIAMTLASPVASWLGYVAFDGVSTEIIAAIAAIAAMAAGAMLADTMVPEAFDEAHDATGLITIVGFFAAFMLSELGA